MRSNIETIKFTGLFGTVFVALTYIAALNIEIGFFQPNWSWISNNFVLTICGGAFASFMVVMLCEIQKYRSNKLSCENYLFSQAMYLYSALFSMHSSITSLLQNKDSIVPKYCLDDYIHMALGEITALQSTDYFLFDKRNRLVKRHRKLCIERAPTLRAMLERHGIYLKLAINIVQRENLKTQGYSGVVATSNPMVAKTLNRIDSEVTKLLDEISDYLTVIEQSTRGRCNWTVAKEKIKEGSVQQLNTFEDFIGAES